MYDIHIIVKILFIVIESPFYGFCYCWIDSLYVSYSKLIINLKLRLYSYFPYRVVFTRLLQGDDTILFMQQDCHLSNLPYITTVTKSASSIKFDPKHGEWLRSYYAIGLLRGVAEVYNCDHRRTYSSSPIKSDTLSLAFSLQVSIIITITT